MNRKRLGSADPILAIILVLSLLAAVSVFADNGKNADTNAVLNPREKSLKRNEIIVIDSVTPQSRYTVGNYRVKSSTTIKGDINLTIELLERSMTFGKLRTRTTPHHTTANDLATELNTHTEYHIARHGTTELAELRATYEIE